MSEATAGRALVQGLTTGILGILFAVLAWALPTMLTNRSLYQPFSLELLSYAGLLAVAGVLVLRGSARFRWPLTAVVLVAGWGATAAVSTDALLGPAHWSWRATGWALVLLFLDRPVKELAAVIVAQLALVTVQVAADGALDRTHAVQLAVVGMLNAGAQVAMAVAAGVLRRAGRTADGIAFRDAAVRTADLVAEQVLLDHHARSREIAVGAVPLLEGLRDGTLSPDDPDVRLRCAGEAARLRRLMAEADDVDDPFVHEVQAAADVAQRAGVRVELAVKGPPVVLPRSERRLLAEPLIAVLTRARTRARITVVNSSSLTVSVIADLDGAFDFPGVEVLRAGEQVYITMEKEKP